MIRSAAFALVLTLIACQTEAGVITFGSEANSFDMEFVTIGSIGNTSDDTGKPKPAGSVAYEYGIGKYEVSRDMIDKYNSAYGTMQGLEIEMNSMVNYGGATTSTPGTGISWNEAARFVNWLNTSQGHSAAYKFSGDGVNDNIETWSVADVGYDSTNLYRNSNAVYVLPSVHEWYKAAYYDPASSSWRDYATLNGDVPTAVASGTDANTAVYGRLGDGPAAVNQAGGENAFGVVGMNGNVFEWEETSSDLTNATGDLKRGVRGGEWRSNEVNLKSTSRNTHLTPDSESFNRGFRVARLSVTAPVPEPSTAIALGLLSVVGFAGNRRRRRNGLTA